jgi:hypothetical protein
LLAEKDKKMDKLASKVASNEIMLNRALVRLLEANFKLTGSWADATTHNAIYQTFKNGSGHNCTTDILLSLIENLISEITKQS